MERTDEIEEDNNKNNNSKIRKLIILFIMLGILTILYYIEKILYYLISLIVYYWPLTFIIMICIHLLTIRYIVYQILFIGQVSFIDRHNKYATGVNQALIFERSLSIMLRSLLSLSDNSIEKTYSKLIRIDIDIETCMDNVNHFIDVFSKMKYKFKQLSDNQDIFYNYLLSLKEEMNKLKILEKLSTEIQKKGEQPVDSVVILPYEIQNIFENNFDKVFNLIKELIYILSIFMNYEIPWYSYKAYKNFFTNDLLGSLNQWQIEISRIFNIEEKQLKTKDNTLIDYIIINSEKIMENKKKNLIIICSPNGSPYQYFCKNLKLNNYLNKGIDILLWNYRGYGYSTGKVTINNIKSDIIELYEEIISLKKYGKIGVHGISVGGIPACYLAYSKPDICLLISDRNFGQIDFIIKDYFMGNFLFYFYKFICFPETRTIDNFIKSKGYKIILNDPKDNIVRECGSLKSLVSEYFIKNFLIKKKEKSSEVQLILNDNSIKDTNDEKDNFYTEENSLNLLFDNEFEVNDFIDCLIDISERIINDNLSRNISLFEKIKMKLFTKKNPSHYLNLEDNPLNIHAIEYLKNKIGNFFEKFEAAGDSLERILDIEDKRKKNLFITTFFNNFLIFGIKHYENNNIYYYSTEGKEEIIKEAIGNLDDIINSQEIIPIKEKTIIKDLIKLQSYLNKIEINMKLIEININRKNVPFEMELIPEEHSFEQSTLELDNETNTQDSLFEKNYYQYEKILKSLGRGNLISLSCGHNGGMNSNEILSFKYQLEKSGIFNLLNI